MNIKAQLRTIPGIRRVIREVDFYRASRANQALSCPPGHFYSPVVSQAEVARQSDHIFREQSSLHGIKLRKEKQAQLLEQLLPYYRDLPFPEGADASFRYALANEFFDYSDGIFLYLLMRHLQPRQVIEVGSGFSSALMLDTNQYFLKQAIQFTFIEPYPDRLRRLLRQDDPYQLKESSVQDVPLATFEKLQENDILFIDSTHIMKTGSDLHFLLFEVLPILKPGVIIHFHDIHYPFEYPSEWVRKQRRSWNETYVLRAFLMYNPAFEILLFNNYLQRQMPGWFREHMPLCLKDPGASLWLSKKA